MPPSSDPVILLGQPWPPFLNECYLDPACKAKGWEYQIMANMLRFLGYRNLKYINYQLNVSVRSITEAFVNDSHVLPVFNVTTVGVGATDYISNKYERLPQMLIDELTVVYKKFIESPVHGSILHPISDPSLWGVVAGSLALCQLVNSRRLSLIFSSRRLKVINFRRFGLSSQAMRSCWWLILGLILSVFANFLAITLRQPKVDRPPFVDFDSFVSSIESGDCTLLDSAAADLISHTDSEAKSTNQAKQI